MTPEQAAKLRAPFDPAQIGKLPKSTKKDNPKGKCQECGGYHGLPAVHLDYVGHAATTDRLLQVDPEWTWKPMATDERGAPIFDEHGGLWIEMTVCGITRPGYGDATMGHGVKEVIGDAIRNAAMRFGVALDLWSKEDLRGEEHEDNGQGHKPTHPVPPPKTKPEPQGTHSGPTPTQTTGPKAKTQGKPEQAQEMGSPQDREALMGAIRSALEAAALSEDSLKKYVTTHYRGADRAYVTSIEEVGLRMLAHLRGQITSGAVADWLIKQGSNG